MEAQQGGTYAHRGLPERLALYQHDRDPAKLATNFPNVALTPEYIEHLIDTEPQMNRTNPTNQEINAFQLAQAEDTLPELLQHRAQVLQIVDEILQAYRVSQILSSENSRAYEQEVLHRFIERGVIRHRNANQFFTGQYIRWLPDARTEHGRSKIRKASFFRRAIAADLPANQIPATIAISLPIQEAVNALQGGVNGQHEDEDEEEEEEEDGDEDGDQAGGSVGRYFLKMGSRRVKGGAPLTRTVGRNAARGRVSIEQLLELERRKKELVQKYNADITYQAIVQNTIEFRNRVAYFLGFLHRRQEPEDIKIQVRKLFLRLSRKLVQIGKDHVQHRPAMLARANELHASVDPLFQTKQPFQRAAQLITQLPPPAPQPEVYAEAEGEEEDEGEGEEEAVDLQNLQPPFQENPANIHAVANGSFLNVDGYFCNQFGAITGTSNLQGSARKYRSKLLRSGGVITGITTPNAQEPQLKLLRVKFIATGKNLFYRTCMVSTRHNIIFERTPQLYLNMLRLQQQIAH